MDGQLKRGLLDVCVLAAIKSEDSYGYKIIKDMKPYIELSESTLYTVLKRLETETRTTVMYEAPHHLLKTLELLVDVIPGRRITFCKELTKRYESAIQMKIEDAINYYTENPPRGEFVLVIEGISQEVLDADQQAEWEKMTLDEHMEIYLQQGMSKKDAMKAVAADRGISKRDVYQALLNE